MMNEASSDAKTLKVLMQNSKNRDQSSEVSFEEVTKAVMSLKNRKTLSTDVLPSESFKNAPKKAHGKKHAKGKEPTEKALTKELKEYFPAKERMNKAPAKKRRKKARAKKRTEKAASTERTGKARAKNTRKSLRERARWKKARRKSSFKIPCRIVKKETVRGQRIGSHYKNRTEELAEKIAALEQL